MVIPFNFLSGYSNHHKQYNHPLLAAAKSPRKHRFSSRVIQSFNSPCFQASKWTLLYNPLRFVASEGKARFKLTD